MAADAIEIDGWKERSRFKSLGSRGLVGVSLAQCHAYHMNVIVNVEIENEIQIGNA